MYEGYNSCFKKIATKERDAYQSAGDPNNTDRSLGWLSHIKQIVE